MNGLITFCLGILVGIVIAEPSYLDLFRKHADDANQQLERIADDD